ncbi:DUF501 domain-containing protein [Pontimonas sp.]|uniref:DUF501 domain-containing protein n=1 Tax=Pontimonas sp. TaxID=2304492 RepID=UPI00286FB44D|nr:DUF501 domain-containing protein [Pontimonas sp.]MDR9396239.1 DUF501 domain-containing protein [Pontimonas sp.]MDR9434676.1 DUF501 domain-containing protein [Pontimonas sp.]
MTWEEPSVDDHRQLARQLGRPMRGLHAIAARCSCGAPAVVVTLPRVDDHTPFPTLYYLSLPSGTKEASRLEAAGRMADYEARLREDAQARAQYHRAHNDFLHTRAQLGTVPEIEGISAGGMPERVKCLHALIAHSLAEGPGVNPVGDWALADTQWSLEVCQCSHDA